MCDHYSKSVTQGYATLGRTLMLFISVMASPTTIITIVKINTALDNWW